MRLDLFAEIDELRGQRSRTDACGIDEQRTLHLRCRRLLERDRGAFEGQTEFAFSTRGIRGQRRDILEPVLAHAGRDAHIRQDLAGIQRQQRWFVVQIHVWHHPQRSLADRRLDHVGLDGAGGELGGHLAGAHGDANRSADCQRNPPSPVSVGRQHAARSDIRQRPLPATDSAAHANNGPRNWNDCVSWPDTRTRDCGSTRSSNLARS